MNAPVDAANVPHAARLKARDFILLCEHGAFDDHGKSELIEGEIICRQAQHSRHARAKSELAFELTLCLRSLRSPLQAIVEVTIALSEDSMPEPDIVLTNYRGDGPVPLETVALVVEVSDTTLAHDLGRKSVMYARAGIAEYWVIDLNEDRCLLHMGPGADGYDEQIDVPFGETLHAGTIDGLAVESTSLI